MTTLKLTSEQKETLKESLISYLSDLRMEMADTDNSKFRQGLQHKKELLNEVLAQLEEG